MERRQILEVSQAIKPLMEKLDAKIVMKVSFTHILIRLHLNGCYYYFLINLCRLICKGSKHFANVRLTYKFAFL